MSRYDEHEAMLKGRTNRFFCFLEELTGNEEEGVDKGIEEVVVVVVRG